MDETVDLPVMRKTNPEFKTTQVFKSINPFIDIGNLLIEDLDPFDYEHNKEGGDEYLKSVARDNVQYLFNKIWEIPSERVEEAIVVKLPDPVSRIPREKPIPKYRDKTRWERFAQLKGIQKAKRSKMVWSEETQSWMPRYGYKRANDDTKDWLVEVPDKSDPYKDYIGEKLEKKKERTAKNELRRLSNIRNEQSKKEEYPGLPPEKKSSEQISRQLNRATSSTASLGKFTEKFKDEKRPKNAGLKRKFLSNENSAHIEKHKQMEILARLQSKKNPLNVDKAVGNLIQEKQNLATEAKSRGDFPQKKPVKSRAVIRKKSRARKGTQSRSIGGKRNRSKGRK